MLDIRVYANFVAVRLINFAVKRCYHKFDVDILFETKCIIAWNLSRIVVHLISCQLSLESCIDAVRINSSFKIQFVN